MNFQQECPKNGIYLKIPYNAKRILIAHELGHIVNKELMDGIKDNEEMANLFAFIALEDKMHFYQKKCKKFTPDSNLQIFNDILNICPIPPNAQNH
ncbi:MAG: hypothetical protein LBH07_07920 [Treponema sp.]|jgi:hypothetical protein|nr:hypothetical protein [Treponema sp.]